MARSIVTQDGAIVNYDKLLAVYVDEKQDADGKTVGYEMVGAVDPDEKTPVILLGTFPDEKSADYAMASLIRWLKTEAFSTYEIPAERGDGDA